jgi:hypothetical protein
MSTLDEHARAGIAALSEQRVEDAITAFNAALALDASRPDLNHALGMAYLQRGEVGSAIPALEKAVELSAPYDHPDHQLAKREFRENLAMAYRMADRTAAALGVLSGTIEMWPEEVSPRILLGQLYLGGGRLEEALKTYDNLADFETLDAEQKLAAFALTGAVRAFQDDAHEGSMFLEAHQGSYKNYFDEVSAGPVSEGWYAEAARMARGDDGEPRPYIPEGARPYALARVDLVNPENGEIGSVYSEREPMIVALNGLEPLAQVAVVFPWSGWNFDVGVSSQCPWHWLTVLFELEDRTDASLEALDECVGDWYLAGYNGDFGDDATGRFHYVTDPDITGERSVSYTFDLGRASMDAIQALLRRLTVLNDHHPLKRVVFGSSVLLESE